MVKNKNMKPSWMIGLLVMTLIMGILTPGVASAEPASVTVQEYIMIDQFGYRPGGDKVAVLVDPQSGFNASGSYVPGSTIQVRRVSDDVVVHTGSPVAWNGGATQENSGDRGWWYDFSSVTAEGEYYIYDVQGNYKSHNFKIAENVYNELLKAAIRTFYYQRMGTPHLAEHAGEAFADGAAFIGPHQDTQARSVFDQSNPATERDLSGGWADAGDYNKYVTYTAQPINELLSAYALKPEIFTDDYNIPESGNGIPDVLDELKWELDWLKKMQESDGGVLLKVGYARNVGGGEHNIPPSTSTRYRYYLPKASSSTIVTTLNFAHAALVFEKFPSLQGYAQDMEARAIKAWNWYHENPKSDNIDNGEVEAGDADMSLQSQSHIAGIASIYLYALTGNETYHNYFKDNYKNTWPLIDAYWGLYNGEQADAIMFYTTLPNADPAIKAYILERRDVQDFDHRFNESEDLYRSYVPGWAYHWGSLQVRARMGATAYDFVQYDINAEKRDNYDKRAQNILHYFHGVNPFGWVYLTNMGDYGAEKFITQIYHSWFEDGTQWDYAPPGYLPGGPSTQYSGTSSPPLGQPEQKMYRDWNGIAWDWPRQVDASWEISENAIYYQAGYIKLLAKYVSAPPVPTELPKPPTGIVAKASDYNSIIVSWAASRGTQRYDIEVDGTVIDNGSGTSYIHTNLISGTTHQYRVRAINQLGVSDWTPLTTAVVAVPPVPPATPSDVKATADSAFSISVNWNSSERAVGYEIEVDGVVNYNGAKTSYLHKGLVAKSTHKYRVRAKNDGGTSAWSSIVSVTTPTAPPTNILDLSHNGMSGYTFGQSTDQIKRYQTFVADTYTAITNIQVKLRKTGTPGDVRVELYAVKDNKPVGAVLATTKISARSITDDYKVVAAPLKYNNLKAGKEYAIVLSQTTPGRGGIYEWCSGIDISSDYDFGKYTEDASWIDESTLGEGWLKVYVRNPILGR